MRRTKATLIYRRTKNLRAVQLLVGHTKLENLVRYLGIEVETPWEFQSRLSIKKEPTAVPLQSVVGFSTQTRRSRR